MNIIVNGKSREVAENTTVAGLLEVLKLSPQTIAVEYNRDILDPKSFDQITLAPDDCLEIVRFVGGG